MTIPKTLIDAHVHLYDCYDAAVFFDAASNNIAGAAERLGMTSPATGCLVLTETPAYHCLRELRNGKMRNRVGAWRFDATQEDSSLVGHREGAPRLILIAGRQASTREGLEVLSLCCSEEIPDGLPLRAAVQEISSQGAIAVIPWGFGKWWFGRRTILEDYLMSAPQEKVFLGDNSGRLRWAPPPRTFATASSRGLLNLPGSDPLPLSSETEKVGRYGFVLDAELDAERPAEHLRTLLHEMTVQPQIFGRREGLVGFCRSQLALCFTNRV